MSDAKAVHWVRGEGIGPQEVVFAQPLNEPGEAIVMLVGGISHPQGRLDITAYVERGETGVVGVSRLPGLRAELHVLGWSEGDPYPEAEIKLFSVQD